MNIKEKYYVRTETIETAPNCWNTLRVTILQNGKEIGSYNRNYSTLYNTFVPFIHHKKEYALYSPDYTSTRIMTLPDCKDLCGEDHSTWGFCPVDYYVPYRPEDGIHGDFGFIAGCVWGDDWSWKLQFLDLRNLTKGEFKREEKFGYLPLPDNIPLEKCVDMETYYDGMLEGEKVDDCEKVVTVAVQKVFDFDENFNATLRGE